MIENDKIINSININNLVDNQLINGSVNNIDTRKFNFDVTSAEIINPSSGKMAISGVENVPNYNVDDGYSTTSRQFYAWGFDSAQSGITGVANDPSTPLDNVTIKFSGSSGFTVDDKALIDMLDESGAANPVILGGSSVSNAYNDFLKSAMGNDYPPKTINFEGFSAGCRSATKAAASYINQQLLEGNQVDSINLTLCDPGTEGNSNFLLSTSYGKYDVNSYEDQLQKLKSDDLQLLVEMVSNGCSDSEIIDKIYSNYNNEITIAPSDLSTYFALKNNQPTTNIFVGMNNPPWDTREDFQILGNCTNNFTVYKFNAPHSGRTVNGQDGINLIFNEIFGNNSAVVDEEKLKLIVNHPQFEVIGVYNKEIGGFEKYTREDLIDENGDYTSKFYELLSISEFDITNQKLSSFRNNLIFKLNYEHLYNHQEKIFRENRNSYNNINELSKNSYSGDVPTLFTEDEILSEYYQKTIILLKKINKEIEDSLYVAEETILTDSELTNIGNSLQQ